MKNLLIYLAALLSCGINSGCVPDSEIRSRHQNLTISGVIPEVILVNSADASITNHIISEQVQDCRIALPFNFNPVSENLPDNYVNELAVFLDINKLGLCNDPELNSHYKKNLPDFVKKEKMNHIYSGDHEAFCIGVFELDSLNRLLLFAHQKQSDDYSAVILELQWFDDVWNFHDHLIAGCGLIGESSIMRSFKITYRFGIEINTSAHSVDFETGETFTEEESYSFVCDLKKRKFVQ